MLDAGEAQCSRCVQRGLQCTYPDAGSHSSVTEPSRPDFNSQQHIRPQTEQAQLDSSPINQPTTGIDLQTSDFPGIQNAVPSTYDAQAIDIDLWDPNILSTTNWLNAIDIDLSSLPVDFAFANTPTTAYQSGLIPAHQPWNVSPSWQENRAGLHGARVHEASQNHAPSPFAISSILSGPSVGSTESAADVCAAQDDSSTKVGEYYVDGETARLPRTKRRKLSLKQSPPSSASAALSAFTLRNPLSPSAELKHRIDIPTETCDTFVRMFQHTCLDVAFPWPAFESTEFPPKDVLEHMLGLYFARFHQTLPFMHPASFKSTDTHWLLLLAMIALGSFYLDAENAQTFAISMQEFLRRCMTYSQEDPHWVDINQITLAQIRTLHAVGLAYSGHVNLRRRGLGMQQDLVDSYSVILANSSTLSRPSSDCALSEDSRWTSWIESESLARLAYSIWLLDCMWVYQFQQRPLLGISDTNLPLPCPEKVWNAGDRQEWGTLFSEYSKLPTLSKALQEIYIDKRLPRETGQFARIILIHGLFHRSWEVERYFSNPISGWEPTAKKQSSSEVLPSSPVPLLTLPVFNKWQNSVCDCLDILHWQANATIGEAGGFEHPTVAFLHLARVVLLSPIERIVKMAKAMTQPNERQKIDMAAEKRAMQRWAIQGQYKARLAAIHAGVVFWHIRRYSVDGFYEAPAAGLAALMLWAFGTFSTRKGATQRNTSNIRARTGTNNTEPQDEISDDSTCDIILLDRPADDEIVQQFVRRGHTMKAHITGVGDLYGPHGPERVLNEGCKLLRMLRCWGVGATWLELLESLADVSKRERTQL